MFIKYRKERGKGGGRGQEGAEENIKKDSH